MSEIISEHPLVPSKKERRELERDAERRAHQQHAHKGKLRTLGIALLLLLVVGGGGVWLVLQSAAPKAFDATRVCIVEGGVPLAMHIHPQLHILLNGEAQTIPANIGVGSVCVRPVHTHDSSGEIHVESNVSRDFRLGEFFAVWKKTFTKEQILDAKIDATHRIVMTVNGNKSDAYENLIMHDKDDIEIRYEAIP